MIYFYLYSALFGQVVGQETPSMQVEPMQVTHAMIPEDLLEILTKIGVPPEDLLSWRQSGILTRSILEMMTGFAKQSNGSRYAELSLEEKRVLTRFCLQLYEQRELSQNAFTILMRDEKIAIGMSLAEIEQLHVLVQQMQGNPNYTLTDDDLAMLHGLLPYIQENPEAFGDLLSPLLACLSANEVQTEDSGLFQVIQAGEESLHVSK